MRRKYFFILLLLIFLSITIFSAENQSNDLIQKIRSLEAELKEFPDDLTVLHQAKEVYTRYLELTPKDDFYRVNYGKILINIGKRDWFLPTKLWYIITGINEMDDAVKSSAESYQIRVTRADTCFDIREYFSANDICISDYEYILLRRDKFSSYLTIDRLMTIYINLGTAYKYRNDYISSKKYLRKVIDIYPGSNYSKKAQQLLSDMK